MLEHVLILFKLQKSTVAMGVHYIIMLNFKQSNA